MNTWPQRPALSDEGCEVDERNITVRHDIVDGIGRTALGGTLPASTVAIRVDDALQKFLPTVRADLQHAILVTGIVDDGDVGCTADQPSDAQNAMTS